MESLDFFAESEWREPGSRPAGLADQPGGRKLRLVVFTGGPLSPVNRVFFERLAQDQFLELAAIIVDDYRGPKKSLLERVRRGWRAGGTRWLGYKLGSKLRTLMDHASSIRLYESTHPTVGDDESYEAFEQRTGVPVYWVSDIHHDESLALLASLQPELGVIVGGRILRDSVITIPTHGTLNIHKRKVPDYRGGGPVGYWEVLAGERSIGVTIHFATAQVDAGAVLAEASIPIEECDTLESLQIKGDLVGARLYHTTLRKFALGERQGVVQDPHQGRTYRHPGEYQVHRLQRRLARQAARRLPRLRRSSRPQARLSAAFRCLRYLLSLPLLLAQRRRLIASGQAPVFILQYQVAANRPVHPSTLPLERFVEQIEFLRRFFCLVPLDEAIARLRANRNDQVAVALTFDGGYRANRWAYEYLSYYGIPATLFLPIEAIREGRPYEHDVRAGYPEAYPQSEPEFQSLAEQGFTIGSQGLYHEDFATLDPDTADAFLRHSRQWIRESCKQIPDHFAFPPSVGGKSIGAEMIALASKHYGSVHLTTGRMNIPGRGQAQWFRIPAPETRLELAMILDGTKASVGATTETDRVAACR